MACTIDQRLRVVTASSPRGTFQMAVLAGDDLVSKEIEQKGFWEIRSPAQLLELAHEPNASLPATGTFVDVGANLGFYSLLFAHSGYNVLAVEPMLLNRKAIETSLCLNADLATRVTLLPYALSRSATARCVIRADDRNAGNGKLTCSASERCGRPPAGVTGAMMAHATICEPVTMSTLDDVLSSHAARLALAPIVAVKMDVEGQECNVLGGGRTLLSAHRPHVLVVEANRQHVRACLTRAANEHAYRITSWQLGDVNWILTRRRVTPFALPATEAAAAPTAPLAATLPASSAAACTWLNGCCYRHRNTEVCRRTRPAGMGKLPSKGARRTPPSLGSDARPEHRGKIRPNRTVVSGSEAATATATLSSLRADVPHAPSLAAPIAPGDRATYDARVASLIERLRAPSAEYHAAGLDDTSGLDNGLFRSAGLTMQPPGQLRGLQLQLEALVDAGLDGDIYETGTWRAGTAIFAVCLLQLYEQLNPPPAARAATPRHFWFFDSFEGFRATDNVNVALSTYLSRRVFAAPLELVMRSFAHFGALTERVHLVKGLFESSVPAFGPPPRPIALLRLDGDLYSSTRVVLEHFYRRVQPGGYVIVDDYRWHPRLAGAVRLCKAAVDEFRESVNLSNETAPMTLYHDVWHWRVPLPSSVRRR